MQHARKRGALVANIATRNRRSSVARPPLPRMRTETGRKMNKSRSSVGRSVPFGRSQATTASLVSPRRLKCFGVRITPCRHGSEESHLGEIHDDIFLLFGDPSRARSSNAAGALSDFHGSGRISTGQLQRQFSREAPMQNLRLSFAAASHFFLVSARRNSRASAFRKPSSMAIWLV